MYLTLRVHQQSLSLALSYIQSLQTGFDSHKGRQVPVLQGIIVSSQFAESLAAGSEVQQQITIESAAKKKQYRVLDNWKRIVNGKLLRTRMDAEYGRS